MSGEFYVYVYFRLDGTPCYVGKGKRDRIRRMDQTKHNRFLARIISKSRGSLPSVKIRSGLTEKEAFAIEIAMIAAIGRVAHGGPLVNMTDGGEGAAGNNPSAETRARFRVMNLGIKRSSETLARMREAQLKKPPVSALTRAKISAALRRRAPPSPEWRAKLAIASTGRKHSPETIAKMKASHIGQSMSLERRAKISASLTGKKRTAESIAKQFATRSRNRADQPLDAFP